MKPLLIATTNPGKFSEIHGVLEDLPYTFLSLAEVNELEASVEEVGFTHDENALLKARFFHQKTGWTTLAEDSGLEVDALKDELGLHTRRWGAGAEASDQDWLNYFLDRMKSVPDRDRTARFLCSAALILEDGTEHLFHGVADGSIMFEPEAPLLPGLPLSSVFKVHGFDKVYAALTQSEKSKISHRGWAISGVRDFLLN